MNNLASLTQGILDSSQCIFVCSVFTLKTDGSSRFAVRAVTFGKLIMALNNIIVDSGSLGSVKLCSCLSRKQNLIDVYLMHEFMKLNTTDEHICLTGFGAAP